MIKTIGAMISANHAMTFATESSVSPWRNEAWARDGSARNAEAISGMKRLARGQHALASDCIAECWVFIAKADVVLSIANFKSIMTSGAGEKWYSFRVKTYQTFAVRAPRHRCVFPQLLAAAQRFDLVKLSRLLVLHREQPDVR